jgi:hypothetical protein
MHKDRIAEWLLVLVTSRERAASIVGDMLESAATHGSAWFWTGVLRATASLLWRGFAGNPRGMFGLAFFGWLIGSLLTLVPLFISVFIGGVLVEIFGITVRTFGVAIVAGIITATLCQFLVGRWIARRAPGRELSAWLALLIMDQILKVLPSIVALALGHRFPMPDWAAWQPVTWMSVLEYLSCLAGTIWVRRRAVT